MKIILRPVKKELRNRLPTIDVKWKKLSGNEVMSAFLISHTAWIIFISCAYPVIYGSNIEEFNLVKFLSFSILPSFIFSALILYRWICLFLTGYRLNYDHFDPSVLRPDPRHLCVIFGISLIFLTASIFLVSLVMGLLNWIGLWFLFAKIIVIVLAFLPLLIRWRNQEKLIFISRIKE